VLRVVKGERVTEGKERIERRRRQAEDPHHPPKKKETLPYQLWVGRVPRGGPSGLQEAAALLAHGLRGHRDAADVDGSRN
jgi:hypothetical protein